MKSYSSITRTLLSFIFTLAGASVCLGSPTTYTGNLSAAGGGLTGYGAWNNPMTMLNWTVDNTTTLGKWHYCYSLMVPSKDISHIIIEASNGDNPFTIENLFSPSSYPNGWIDSISVQNFSPGGNTPYMPEDMWGIKFDSAMDSTILTINFDSDRRPVWGDFYAKDGYSTCSGWNVVYNAGFTVCDYDPIAPAANGSYQNHILVPDSYIPAPGALILVSIGTALTGVLRKRRAI